MGRGISTAILEASAKAYLHAVNKLIHANETAAAEQALQNEVDK
jgi:hypothetical protein